MTDEFEYNLKWQLSEMKNDHSEFIERKKHAHKNR